MSENTTHIGSARYITTYATYSVMSVPERNRNNGETEPTINDMIYQMCSRTEMDGRSQPYTYSEPDIALSCSSTSLILNFLHLLFYFISNMPYGIT